MSKHTKGTWEIKSEPESILIYSPSGAISYIPHKGKAVEEHEANAKLIAAAPELLEALKQQREFLQGMFDSTTDSTEANRRRRSIYLIQIEKINQALKGVTS